MNEKILEIFKKCSLNEITPEDAMSLVLKQLSSSATLPENYDAVKDSFLNFMENSFMLDVNMQPMNEIVKKTDSAVDNFAQYILKSQIFKY